jgi:type IV pilus assembly protein PilX
MNYSSPLILRRQQSGISLVVVLILLLIMTLLGLAVLRGTLLEERMSANLLDRSLSFQAAEAALREGEALAALQTAVPVAGSGCVNGVCESPTATATDRWNSGGFSGWRNATASVSALASRPQFFIEYMGSTESWLECNVDPKYAGKPICIRPVYRVTARSEAADRANVILQSNFVAP